MLDRLYLVTSGFLHDLIFRSEPGGKLRAVETVEAGDRAAEDAAPDQSRSDGCGKSPPIATALCFSAQDLSGALKAVEQKRRQHEKLEEDAIRGKRHRALLRPASSESQADRKRALEGKSGSGRVDFGGARIIKKK